MVSIYRGNYLLKKYAESLKAGWEPVKKFCF